MSASVALRLDGPDVVCEPLCRLGTAWGAYQAAVKVGGARNVKGPGGWRTLAPLSRVREVEAALRHAGFEVRVEFEVSVETAATDDSPPSIEDVEAASGLTLFPFQRDGVRFLRARDRALLLDEMGTGKTVQALAALPEGAPCLVVCPASLKAVWRRELSRIRGEYECGVLQGRGSFRWPYPGEVVVTNYDVLPDEFRAPAENTVVVADEAHALKSYKAARTRRFRALAEAARNLGGRTWLLTGTPLTNRPPDLWGVLQAAGLARHAFGSWDNFAKVFGGAKTQVARRVWAYVWGKPDGERAAGCLRAVSLRREKRDVLAQLPPKTREVLTETELRARDRKALDAVVVAIDAAGIGDETDEEGRRARAKLPHFEGMSEARRLLADAKAPLLASIVESHEDADEPLVVFSAHVKPMLDLGAREGWASIVGETPLAERDRVVQDFQAGRLRGVACTIQAAGVGLTLTRASHVVFLDLDWTPALNAQAEDRLHRIGQGRPVLVTVLAVDHPLERRVLDLCGWKERVAAETVSASARYSPQAVPETAPKPKPRRGPATPQEAWAARALALLTAWDPDRAREENAVGWNRLDGAFGARLAAEVGRGLTDGQWAAVVRMCRKYHRQVGACPEGE